MRSILLPLCLLVVAQVGTPTIRTGDVARSLTAEDIALLEGMVGQRPWLIDGRPLISGVLPITSVTRQQDGSVSVWRAFESRGVNQVILERRGSRWVVASDTGLGIRAF